ncbi:MAG: T9SS type A sorting domain-containing protein [Phaeodactylibacter sp.]|nr:T9SS type A sorting domain-containing protein [Phaeodactylibacter sp.]MCB9275828.1 T9SS type A sorting domain-containing protein [Lewinellaceae bacterium]
MNVSLRRYFFYILLLALGFPLGGFAQNINVSLFQGQVYRDTFISQPNNPNLLISPQHGTVSYPENPQHHFNLTYTPGPDFIGQDHIRFRVWKTTGSAITFQYRDYYFTVAPSRVVAFHDNATTTVGTPVTINVLRNDSTTNGVLILKSIPMVNNGAATMNAADSTITFTPAPGFEGIAYLNYAVCDDLGACDNGTVSVIVLGQNASLPDTMRIFTKKNTPQNVFVPGDYVLTGSPANGQYDDSGDVPVYSPNPNYVGKDYILFDYNGVDKVVEVRVLNLGDNGFAFDDQFYMTPYDGEREFNVLANDFYGVNSSCFYVTSAAQYGTVAYVPGQDAKGVVRYTPPAGFTGVDWFTYSVCPPNTPGNVETATVYVFVSSYEPSASSFYMSTPKRTPLVVGYSVPISQFSFTIEAPAGLGTVTFLEGNVDTLINGQQVTGYNLILYVPYDNVDSGTDDFELEYCVLTNGNCSYTKTVKVYVDILDLGDGSGPMCFDDCVWPGDTNFDGAVNMEDLLPLGLNMGEVGIPRSEVNLSVWYGQYGDNWNDPFQQSPIDMKHLDTDGDSLITGLDTLAISQFYGNTHSMTSVKIPFFQYPIVLQGDIFASPGDLVELDMLMGSEVDPAKNIYGFTFPFQYDPGAVVPGSVLINFSSGSWLAYNSPMLQMTKNNQEGLVDVGFSRTNGISASGHGEVGAVSFIISDDLDGFRPGPEGLLATVGGGMGTVMNGSGLTYGVKIPEYTIHIVPRETVADPVSDPSLLKVYPNPSNLGFINLHLNGGQEFERAMVYSLDGRLLYDTGKVLAHRMQLPVNQLKDGMYFLSVYTPAGVINKKFEVIR